MLVKKRDLHLGPSFLGVKCNVDFWCFFFYFVFGFIFLVVLCLNCFSVISSHRVGESGGTGNTGGAAYSAAVDGFKGPRVGLNLSSIFLLFLFLFSRFSVY